MKHDAKAGQAIYTKKVLAFYDLWVLGFSNSFVWRCPTKTLKKLFTQHTTTNHLDVGVGSGYFLDKCLMDTKRRIALLDLSENSLSVSAERIRRFNPEIYHANILEPLNLKCNKFDSISVNYLLHCLPGTITEKAVVFKNLLPLLNNNGKLFGSTILGQDSKHNYLARKLMAIYNKKGIFGNTMDNLSSLKTILNQYFEQVNIEIEGCVAIFSATKKSA